MSTNDAENERRQEALRAHQARAEAFAQAAHHCTRALLAVFDAGPKAEKIRLHLTEAVAFCLTSADSIRAEHATLSRAGDVVIPFVLTHKFSPPDAAYRAGFEAGASSVKPRAKQSCLRCKEVASDRFVDKQLPPLCPTHVDEFRDGIAWQMLVLDDLPVTRVAQVVPGCTAPTLKALAAQHEHVLQLWRLHSMEPFMRRLRSAGALPELSVPIIKTEARVCKCYRRSWDPPCPKHSVDSQ